MATAATQRKLLFQWLFTLLAPLLFFLIPRSGLITWKLELFLYVSAVAIIMIVFDFFDTAWPAIVLPSVYVILNIAPIEVAFSAWTNTTMWMIIGAFVMTQALESCNLLRRIAILCIRACGGSFTGTIYGLFFAGYVLAWITFCNSWIVMAVLSYAICVAMNTGKSEKSAMLLFAGQIGALTPQLYTFELAYNSTMQASVATVVEDFVVPWYSYPLYNLPGLFITLLFLFLFTKVFKTKDIQFEGAKEYFDNQYKEMGKLSPQELKAAILLVIILVYLVTSPLHGLPIAYGFMIVPYVMFLPGIKIADSKVIGKINWSVVLFVAICLGIGTVSTYLNMGQLLSETLTPLLEDMGVIPSLLMVYLVGGLANLILTPTAMVSMLSAPLMQMSLDLGMSPWPFLMTLIYSTDAVFLPHETAALLLFYGFGLMTMKQFVKFNLCKLIFFVIMFVVIQVPYWYLIGLL